MFMKKKKLAVQIYGTPVLRNVSEEITEITEEIKTLAEDMIDSMYKNNGIGLAAPQIGKNIRMFTIDVRMSEDEVYESPGEAMLCPRMPMALINPVITRTSDEETCFNEGCLSIPEINADVVRPEYIQLQATTIEGQKIDLWCGGLLSRCVQHEIDHLDGIMFTDRAEEESLKEVAADLEDLRQKTVNRLDRRKKRRKK